VSTRFALVRICRFRNTTEISTGGQYI